MKIEARARYIIVPVLFLLLGACGGGGSDDTGGGEVPRVLDEYVSEADPNYRYVHYSTDDDFLYRTYFLQMFSQQWREPFEVDRAVWDHEVVITVPANRHSASPRTAILLVNGGSNDDSLTEQTDDAMSLLAVLTGSVLVEVNQIPNQPLVFADEPGRSRSEDEIIAYSFDKYLDTGDDRWPVLLPMTKAVVRAMDTVQAFLASEQSLQIDDFIVLGGSKRGWTTWLTAAADPRVKAIVPASIDMLNLDEQFAHHVSAYGFYAPAVQDYVDFDLPCRVETPAGQELLRIVDPHEYLERFTMPKVVANSTGDQFFVSDSWRFYYEDLPGPKLLRYSPNTDHSQNTDALLGVISWIDDINDGKNPPSFTWTNEPDGSIRVETQTRPSSVRLWQATNPAARDFRLEAIGPAWTSTTLQDQGGGVYIGEVTQPSQGWTAYMVELTFDESGEFEPDQVYTTGVRVTPDTLPFEGIGCAGQ